MLARHQFTRGAGKATLAGSPLLLRTLPLAAIEFAKGDFRRNLTHDLAFEPAPSLREETGSGSIGSGHELTLGAENVKSILLRILSGHE